jgi:hypothetical protein
VRLGEKFQVTGKWCSFVAVAANDKEISRGKTLSKIPTAGHEDGKCTRPSYLFITCEKFDADYLLVLQDFDFDSFLAQDDEGIDNFNFDTSGFLDEEELGEKFDAIGSNTRFAAKKRKSAVREGIPTYARASAHGFSVQRRGKSSDRNLSSSSRVRQQPPAFGTQQVQQQMQQQQAQASPFGGFGGSRGRGGSAFGSSSSQARSGGLFGAQAALAEGAAPDPFYGGGISPSSFSSPAPEAVAGYYAAGASNPMQNNSGITGNQNLQDYQMQMMLLEQQNKKRLMMARQETDETAIQGRSAASPFSPSSTTSPPQAAGLFGNAANIMQQQPLSITSPRSFGRAPAPPGQHMMGRVLPRSPQPFDVGGGSTTVPEPTKPVNYTTKWSNKPSTEKVLALIELQEFEGTWPEGNEEIKAILGFQIPHAPNQVDAKAWITLLVVGFLELKNAAEEGTWGMVVEKARDWLAANVPTGLEELEKAAVDLVSKN